MDFLSFVKLNSKQDDADLLSFISAIKNIENIPVSSDPRFLSRFLYRKLNSQQTRGFQKWFMSYKTMVEENELPPELNNDAPFLDAINLIITLQNKDPEYKNMIKATRALEYVCLFQFEMPTADVGDVYTFLAVDMYSDLLFNTGTEKEINDEIIIKHVQLLLNDKNFKKHSNKPFTLVFHKYGHLQKQIEEIIKPNGKMIVDDPLVCKVFTPIIEYLFKSLAKKIDKR